MKRFFLTPVVALSLLPVVACAARHHQATGLVVDYRPKQNSIVVSHDPIPGLMDAMVMPFELSKSEHATELSPGDRIRFRIRVKSGQTRVDRIVRTSSTNWSGKAGDIVRRGEVVPDFTLTDQNGQLVRLSDLRGKVVVINFIYTRCPLPDYCPRLMTHFLALQEQLGQRAGSRLVLMTVTFDPQHDTPEVLAAYGRQWKAGSGWYFLTGDRSNIEQVCARLGVEFWPESGLLAHTMATAVIAPDGSLAASIDGSDYDSGQLIDLVADVLEKTK